MICAGENTVSYRTCKKSYQRFKATNFNLEDDDRLDASRKFDDSELEELLKSDLDARRIGRKIKNHQTSTIYPTKTIG